MRFVGYACRKSIHEPAVEHVANPPYFGLNWKMGNRVNGPA